MMSPSESEKVTDRSCEARLRRALRSKFGAVAADVGRDEDLVATLHLDSLTALEFLARVEKEFDILFADDELHLLRTVRQITDAIARFESEFGDAGQTTGLEAAGGGEVG